MSEPKVWWWKERDRVYVKSPDTTSEYYMVWQGDDATPASDAVALVPQVSRDELREAIARSIYDRWRAPSALSWDAIVPSAEREWLNLADAVLDLLADRGLVRPAGPSGRES